MNEHPFIRRERTNWKKRLESIQNLQKSELYPLTFQMPTGVQFELTGRCNLRCKHCYNRSGDNDIQTRMRPEDWLALSRHLVENGGIFQCILSGGEPLMMGDTLIEIMDILHEDKTGFLLISNGLLMDEAWIRKLRKYSYYWIQISIDDSRRDKHDAFRGHVGTWDAATRAAMGISAAGLPLAIAHTITPENFNRFPEMVELAFQLGASELLCGETILSGRAISNENLWLNDEQRFAMYSMIEALQKEWMGKIVLKPSIQEKHQLKYRKSFANTVALVRPNGDVRMDCTMPFTIGNVLEQPFLEIWRSKGIHCWEDPKVEEYIQNLESETPNIHLINHVTVDQRI